MFDKLHEVEARFEEVGRKLADPAIVGNANALRELSKEHRELEHLVEAFRALRKVEGDIAGNRDLISNERDKDLVAMAQDEIAGLEAQRAEIQERLNVLLTPKDPNDAKNVVLEIRSGTGGDEAALFAGELFRMYSRFAEQHGFRLELVSASEGTAGGFKEVIAIIEGAGVYSSLKYESGVHRVQRVPATETQGRIHTSAATVAVLPEAEEADIDVLDKDLKIDVYRSSGAGGQSVNTTDSAVRITHLPTGVVVVCQDERSQHKNKSRAMKILRSRLLDAARAEADAKMAADRKQMVKSGDRSDKIRTYNFPQDRLTDHRIGLTVHNLPSIMQGELDHVVTALRTHYQAEALKGG
ncbi:MAG: peptide chain release factor 1 [Clostridia bacterium]|nr:peptide chain release factor 1 [Deltaproteobacteria bacterium]